MQLKATILSLFCISGLIGKALSQDIEIIDAVPRHRLVSNQEVFQFLDLNTPHLGQISGHLVRGDTSAALTALAEYFRQRRTPRYFFSSTEAEKRIKLFALSFPAEVEQMQKSLAEYVRVYGIDVDWRSPGQDLLGRPHTANTIRFLARQPLAVKSALMFQYTGDGVYLDNFLGQIRDFLADYAAGKTASGANDVFERYYAGHRIRNWLFAHQMLLENPAYSWQDQILMVKAFLLHGARLYDVCKKFHWGNHQLHGLEGLFEITLMYPEFPVMTAWHKVAVERILEHLQKEIKPDGFQFERASHYFKLDIMNYFRVYQLSKINGCELPPVFYARFRKMFDAIVALARPDKALPVLHDAQATYDPQQVDNGIVASNNIAELADLRESLFMSLGALLFTDPVYKFLGDDQLPPALYWFLPADAASEYEKLPIKKPVLASVALEESQYFVMRSGWTENDLYMIIDGGLAKYKPDHSHGQVLGLIAYAFEEDILPNYRVRYSDPSYRTLKNSLVKNVALADNLLQGQGWIDNKARTGFGIWRSLPEPRMHAWLSGEQMDYFSGSHNGFQSTGVEYTRSVYFLKPDGWVVIDEFDGDRPHSFQQIWQGEFTIDSSQNMAYRKSGKSQLLIRQADPSIMTLTTRSIYGRKSLQFEKQGVTSYSFTTLVYPSLKKAEGAAAFIKRFDRPEFQQIIINHDNKTDKIYFRGKENLKLAEIESDAEFVALRFVADSLYAVLLHQGTKLQTEDISIQHDSTTSMELTRPNSGKWQEKILQSLYKP